MQKLAIKSIARNLNHIKKKQIMKAFGMWIKHPHKRPLKPSPQKPPLNLSSKTRSKTVNHSSNNSRSSSIESKPPSPGHRLYSKAQEIQNRKNEIRKSLLPEYSFIPKISPATQKWLKSKSKNSEKPKEEVAIVSGNSLSGFPAQDSNSLKSSLIKSRTEKKTINKES